MRRVYEVVFKENGKRYYFSFDDDISNNTNVIVETEKGLQFAKVVGRPSKINVPENEIKPILRIASDKDYKMYLSLCKDANNALNEAKKMVLDLGLEMNVMSANYTFDKKQLLFSFVADDRVDFRELAKRLAAKYKTRIELRQVGARDKAKEIGGIGQCGRVLCCSGLLNHIDSVSMNMAKNQNLALNPSKINGQCSRLLCCLTYEDDLYKECSKKMPSINQKVNTKFGSGVVVSLNVLERKYKVLVENELHEIVLDDKDDKIE